MNKEANKQDMISALAVFQKGETLTIKQKTFCVKFQKFAIVFIKTMIFTQKLVHVDSNVYFKIVMKLCQIISVNQFLGFKSPCSFFVP